MLAFIKKLFQPFLNVLLTISIKTESSLLAQLSFLLGAKLNKYNIEEITIPSRSVAKFPFYKDLIIQSCNNYSILNGANSQGDTFLHWAIGNDDSDVFHALIGAGHNVNVTNKSGRTPLHLAARMNLSDIVKILI